jgi:hypothetical protein
LQQAVIAQYMNDQRPKRKTMIIEETTICNMWEIAALGVLFKHFQGQLSSAGIPSCG